MSSKFCSFDIEIAKIIPEGASDLDAYRPLGITCAATLLSGDEEATTWYDWWGTKGTGCTYAPQMSKAKCQGLVRYLALVKANGYIPLTWNGLGFDFKILAEESGLFEECKELALSHVDMMFHFFCIKGFAVGLDKVCQSMGLPGKSKGMTGADAPLAWKAGRNLEVLEYVTNDVVQPLRLAELVDEHQRITWITRRGFLSSVSISRLLTVREALKLPEPDVSWMTPAPWSRNKFCGWTEIRKEVIQNV